MNSLSLREFAGLCLLSSLEDRLPGTAVWTGRVCSHQAAHIVRLSPVLKVPAEEAAERGVLVCDVSPTSGCFPNSLFVLIVGNLVTMHFGEIFVEFKLFRGF